MRARFGRLVCVVLCIGGVFVWAALAGPGAAGVPAASAAAAPAQTAQAAGYVGVETCVTCHSETEAVGAHGRAWHPRSPAAAQGCETCHGPGEAHVEAGGDPSLILRFATLTPQEVSETCATCHNRREHALWEGSAHDARNLSCVTCHSVHDPRSPAGQLKAATQPELCAQCHRDKVARLNRTAHMPVREGKMSCATCHNPHGTTNERLLREGDSVAESCTSCHTDKRGPFLFEHAPVRESCVSCHDPHGSPHERMLVAKVPMLCQRCHIHTRHPGSIYDNAVVNSSNRLYARGCVNCHSNIHGSNHPSGVGFVR